MEDKITQLLKTKEIEYIILSIIILLGFFTRLYKINGPIADWHSWRQADTASVSRIFFRHGINLLYPKYLDLSSTQSGIFNPLGLRLVEFPIYNALHVFIAKGLPFLNFEVCGRLVSIIASLFSALFLYLIAKKYYGKWVGLLTAFFCTFLPFNIYYSRTILPGPLSVALGLASIWFFVCYLEYKQLSSLFFSAILFAISTLAKPFSFFYGIPIFYLVVQKFGLKNILKRKELLVFANIAIIPFFIWRIWINQFPAGIPRWRWTFNADNIRFRPAFWRWIFGERIGKLMLGIWGLVPFSFGFLKIKKENLFSHFLFLAAFIYLAIFATVNIRHDYYQIFIVPVISLFLAKGAWYLWNFKESKLWLARLFLIFSVGLMLGMSWYQVREFYKINHPEIIQAGQAIDRIAPKDALIIASYNGDTSFLYQTQRKGWPVVDDSIDNLIGKGASFFVSVNLNDPDLDYLKEKFRILEQTDNYIIIDLKEEVVR